MLRLLFIGIAFISYYIAPQPYDQTFCWWLACLYMLIMWSAIMRDILSKDILSFNVLFSLMLFIVTFVNPLFVQTSYDSLPMLLGDHGNTINKATALVVFAYSIYNFGWHRGVKKRAPKLYNGEIVIPQAIVNAVNALSVIVTIIFVVSIVKFVRGSSIEKNDIESGIIVLLTESILMLSVIVNVIVSKPKNLVEYIAKNKQIIACSMICVVLSFYIGDRTLPLFLLLTLLCSYSIFVRKLNLLLTIALLVVGSVFFYLVGQTRKSEKSLRSGGVSTFVSGSESIIAEDAGNMSSFVDLLPASEMLYLAYEYPDMHGHYYNPGRIFIYASSPIPYLPNMLSEVVYELPIKKISSAHVLTEEYNRTVYQIDGGLGTHVVADIYLSWGIIGVIVFFYLFGLLMGAVQFDKLSIQSVVIYISMVAYALYLPRDTLYNNYRLIVYQLLIIWICQKLTNLKIKTKAL